MVDQRVAVASRGFGRAVAVTLAAAGQAVVVGYSSDAAAARQVVDEIAAAGGRAEAVRADIADENEVAGLFDAAARSFGGVDVVVNSAGRLSLSPIAELDLDALDALHRTNIRGTFVVAREAARRVRPGGAIVMLSLAGPGGRWVNGQVVRADGGII